MRDRPARHAGLDRLVMSQWMSQWIFHRVIKDLHIGKTSKQRRLVFQPPLAKEINLAAQVIRIGLEGIPLGRFQFVADRRNPTFGCPHLVSLNRTQGQATLREMFQKWFQSWFKTQPPRDTMGDRGENLAARFIRNLGYRIIIRNFRCEVGEIDIIARDGATLVFVEVKTRSYDDPAPEDQVHIAKQQQLTRVAKTYLSRYGTPRPPARFDVIAVVWPDGREPIIRHIMHAFEATS